jgi:7,8-dihydro-6-hydroxymethylpterin-pyrophosphokinase
MNLYFVTYWEMDPWSDEGGHRADNLVMKADTLEEAKSLFWAYAKKELNLSEVMKDDIEFRKLDLSKPNGRI